MFVLKQSTSIEVPFFAHDANGDGVTGITDGNWTKRIKKSGGSWGAMTVTVSEGENGWYHMTLSTSHTDTLGQLAISLSATGVKRVNMLYQVRARIHDDLAFPNVSGRGIDVDATGGVEITANQNVNVAQWLGVAPNALIGGRVQTVDAVASGTADSGSTTTVVDTERTEADADYWKGSFIHFTSGSIAGQTRLITGFDAGTDTLTFAPALTQSVGTNTYVILPSARVDLHSWLGSVANALISGRVDANAQVVGDKTGYTASTVSDKTGYSLATDGISAASVSAAAVTKIRSLFSGTADSGSTTTLVDAALTEADTDYWKGKYVLFTSGSISGQCRLITGFNPATDTLTFSPATTQAVGTNTYELLANARVDVEANNDKTGYALTSGERTSIAEAIFKLDLSTITGEAARSLLNAVRFLRNKWTLIGTTLSVKKEDDVTEAWSSTVTTNASAEPITSSDPG